MSRILRRIVLNLESVRGLSTKVDLNQLIMSMNTSKKSNKKSVTKKKYAASHVTLQVLGSGAHGAPASLYVTSDQTRYLFNCGEGTQRLAHEHKMKLAKLEHIFITKSSWKNFGGLPGLSLTVRDAGVTNLSLHGPKQIDDIYYSSKSFIALGDLKVTQASLEDAFEDSVMKVTYVLIDSDNPLPTEEDDGDDTSILKEKKVCTRAPGSDQSIGFICKLHPKQGMLLLDQCEKMGVPLGPLLGKLKAGEDVTLHDGTEVKSKDVTSPDDPGPIFIVVECPDKSYLSSLVSKPEFKRHQLGTAENETSLASAIVHFSPPEVMCLPEYREWMNQFPPTTTHLVINSDNYCQGTTAVHRLQHKLNLLHKDIFPLLKERPETSSFGNIVQGNSLVKCALRPKNGVDLSSRLLIDPLEYVQETMDEDGFKDDLESLKRKLVIADIKGAVYPRVTFLGTGSCIPNKTRNTSGILVETGKDSCFLMDCGEASSSQIVRIFGLEETERLMRCLKGVYVSHLHADHHIGLAGIILDRLQAFKKIRAEASNLILLLPGPVIPFINKYSCTYENIGSQVEIIKLSDGGNDEYSKFKKALDFKDVKTCYVRHCGQSFGVFLEHNSGWKMVYSGDTEPCDSLIEMGKNCDLLIHEATMEDGLEDEARKKRHSTTSEAIKVGQEMGAKFTLLTHFSQRYAKIPLFSEKFSDSVGIAFDNMQISLSQLHLLPIMMPTMKKMFSKYYEEMEIKTEKMHKRKEKRARIIEELEKKKLQEAFTK